MRNGIIYAPCDDPDGVADSRIHGIGGVQFCGVRTGTTVTLALNDEVVGIPEAVVTCPSHEDAHHLVSQPPFLVVRWHMDLGRAAPSLTFDVPEDCLHSQILPREDRTDIGGLLDGGTASTGTASLTYA